MSDSAEVYSTKQVADSLGLGAAMVRKYAVALEKLTGAEIPIKRRDGRQFDREHFDTISRAKALVDSNNGLNIETALKMALTQTVEGAEMAYPALTLNTETLQPHEFLAALGASQEPVIAKLRQLRMELRQLQLEQKSLPAEDKTSKSNHGPVVRFALWLERLLRL